MALDPPRSPCISGIERGSGGSVACTLCVSTCTSRTGTLAPAESCSEGRAFLGPLARGPSVLSSLWFSAHLISLRERALAQAQPLLPPLLQRLQARECSPQEAVHSLIHLLYPPSQEDTEVHAKVSSSGTSTSTKISTSGSAEGASGGGFERS